MMTTLGVHLIWCFIQVSLLLGVAAAVYAFAARRSPDMASWAISCFLGLTLLITPLAFVPFPSWISIVTRSSDRTKKALANPLPSHSESDGAQSADSAITTVNSENGMPGANSAAPLWLAIGRQFLQQLDWNQAGTTEEDLRGSHWLTACSWLLVGGMTVGLIRFLCGVLQLRGLLRDSQLIEDSSLNHELQLLRLELACRKLVRVYEAGHLKTAATFGWLRPLILLPADWREWTEVERRAVLAHELAHIARGDFAAWWLARLSLAIHGYHPLLHWLVNRLQLQQELAADATAARAADSRLTYLKVLAAMLLRHDDTRRNGLVRAFLPANTTLSRRIAMLRVKDDRSRVSNHRMFKLAVLVGGLIAAAATATFRIEAQDQAPAKPAAPAKPTAIDIPRKSKSPDTPAEKVDVQDAAKLKQTRIGVIVFRPAKFFSHAGLQPVLAKANQGFLEQLNAMLLPSVREVHLDRINEVCVPLAYSYDASKPDHRRSLITGLDTLRVADGVDISVWFRKWIPSAQVTRGQQVTIHTLPTSEFKQYLSPELEKEDQVSFVEVQPGTIHCVGMRADAAAEYVTGQKSWHAITEDFPDWQRVNRGVLSFVCNEQMAQIAEDINPLDPTEAVFKPVFQHLRRVLGCVEFEDELKAEVVLEVAGAAKAEEVKQSIDAVLLLGRLAVTQQTATPEGQKQLTETFGFEPNVEMIRQLLENARTEMVGQEIHLTTHSVIPIDRTARLKSNAVK